MLMIDLALIPGGSLYLRGIKDLEANNLSEEALLVLVAAPRLRRLGLSIPAYELSAESVEHRLYTSIELRLGTGAHSFYNSYIRLSVSFARALEREQSVHPAEH